MAHRRNYGPPPRKQPRLLYWSIITIMVVLSAWLALKAMALEIPQVCIDLGRRLNLPYPKTDEEKRAARQRVWLLVEAGDDEARRCWYAINKEQRK